MNIAKILEEKALKFAQKPAIIFRDQPINFLELKSKTFALAASLKKTGLKRGEKIALYLPNWPEYVFSYLAGWVLGLTVVPLDFMLTEEELASCLKHSEAKALIAKFKATIPLEKLKADCPDLKQVISCQEKVPGALFFNDLLGQGTDKQSWEEIDDKEYAIIFYTSGTTGAPKGVLINYKQLGAPPKSMEFFVDLNEKDITVCALPFSHLGGLIYLQNCIFYGLTVVLMERFIPLEFLKNVEKYKITCFWIVPSMYYAFLQLKEFETFDLSSLRWIVTFGASNSPDALRRFHQFCPKAHLLNGWGMTETNAPTVVLPFGSDKIESVGRPLPWVEVNIFDDKDQFLPPEKVGEVVVKSWVVTDGYYKDQELTAQTIRNGWFHTGDLGKFDAEGNLYIVGRKKEMIKVGGEIVFEPEVEGVIHKHPDVAEAAVIGVQDKLRGEVPKAYIVLKEGKRLNEEDLRFFLRQHLAHFKIPHYFEFFATLPKNRTGKIDKELLRKK
ncbi:MAG: AMP-binding protein [Candidatus Omnitrophica bacterium]|nr:AMP-binding protein [Candidatus Omnitrophota bacterium]MDD5652543.1 AMP-binding protein [Candidatus Omnitrophota bacterium]